MKLRIILGWIVILMLSFAPVFLFFYFGNGFSEMNDYSSITYTLGEIFGLVGMTMFALTFVLSTRIPFIEDIFGGLDKVYINHGILGGTALIFLLFHPIFLVLKFVPSEIQTAAKYLFFSSSWSVNFGILALFGMIILIYLTLYSKIKYHKWKYTHEFFGLMLVFAILHIFLVRGNASRDFIFKGYYIYAAVVSVIGLSGFSYSLFIKNRLFKNAVYSVEDIHRYKDFFEITLTPEHKPIQYKSGQFIFVRFYNENLSKEPHPFSIASKTNDFKIKLVIKELGDFTKRLIYLNKGDKVSIEGPYGRFNYKREKYSNQVWIAGGIGITPFLGMAKDLEDFKDFQKDVFLFYSVKNSSDFIGYNQLKEISSKRKNFHFIPWNSEKQGYLTANNIKRIVGDLKNKDFFLCGPTIFKESIIKNLKKQGVSKSNIHEEIFDLR